MHPGTSGTVLGQARYGVAPGAPRGPGPVRRVGSGVDVPCGPEDCHKVSRPARRRPPLLRRTLARTITLTAADIDAAVGGASALASTLGIIVSFCVNAGRSASPCNRRPSRDVAGVARPVAFPVQISDGGSSERDGTDDEQLVVLAAAHDRQRRRGCIRADEPIHSLA